MPKSSHDTVLNEIPVVQRHTLVPSLNDISDKTRKLQQHYQNSKDAQQKAKKSSLTALNLIDKDEQQKGRLVSYGETIMSTRKMYASSNQQQQPQKLTSKSNHFDLGTKDNSKSREKLYNVISVQPSKHHHHHHHHHNHGHHAHHHHHGGFDELDLLLNKAKNLQSFQTNLLSSSKHSKTNSSNNNISTSTSSSSSSKSRSNKSSSSCAKSVATESRVSLNQADVISSNLARAKETIKKMSSSTNLEAANLTNNSINNNSNTNSNNGNNNNINSSNNNTNSNELPVLVPLPMPFSAPSYSSFYNFGSNPNISVPQTPTPPPVQQQQQQPYSNSNMDPLQPLSHPIQMPSNIPLVIPLGPPETTSLYNLNQPYYQPQQIPQPVSSQAPPLKANPVSTTPNHKQKIKELKLKKQSKQSKSMESSINKIPQEDEDAEFELSKNKLLDLKNLNKVDSIIPDNLTKSFNEPHALSNQSIPAPVLPQIKTRLPPPPLPPALSGSKTNINEQQQTIKKSNEDLTKQNEVSQRLKQPSLHITEPIKTPEPQQKDSIMLITDGNYSVPQTTVYSNKAEPKETKPIIKQAVSQENISQKTKETQNTKQSSTSKKLNDLTELLQNSKYGIYKSLVNAGQNQLQSKSAIQPPVQAQTKPKQMETKAVSTNDISDLKQIKQPQQMSVPAEYKTSLHIGKQFNSNEITVHLVDDLLEDKKTPIKKLLIHCNRIEPISSRSVTVTPGQFNSPVDMNLNDSKNYLRKELKREIVLPVDCDIDSLESYLENGYLYFKCFLLKPPQINELKHAQIVSLPRIDFKSSNLDPTSDQSTIIKRSLLNSTTEKKSKDYINKSILKLNSDDLNEANTQESTSETTTTTTSTNSQFNDQLTTTTSSSKSSKTNRGRHQSLPSGSKSVRFNMNNRTFQLEDSLNLTNDLNKNDLITGPSGSKLTRHNSNTSTSSAQQYRHRHRSNSNKSKSDQQHQHHHNHHHHQRRTPSNSNTQTLSTRLSNDLIQDGFNCITKDGLENIFLTYFFKLPSCSPSDRTQVRIEKNSILKLKIIQEKNFAKKSKKRHHRHQRHSHRHHSSSSSRRHAHDSSSSSLSSSFISSALSSSSDSSLSSSLDTSDESTVNNEKITKIKQDDETTKIVLREFSRRCRLPYKVFKFDETGVTVSFINNDWVRVEIPILEILDSNLMATMTSETNLSLLNNSKKVKSSNNKLDAQDTEEKLINKLKMGGSSYKY